MKPVTFFIMHLTGLRGDVFVTHRGIEGGQVTGHGLHISIGQVPQFFDHVTHGAGGNTVRFKFACSGKEASSGEGEYTLVNDSVAA